MELIVTHNNADFDALASVWALYKLIPNAVPLELTLEKNVKKFLSLYMDNSVFMPVHDLNRSTPTIIHIVDTKQIKRINPLIQNFIKSNPVEVQITDHHKWNQSTIPGAKITDEEIGACTTIFVEKIFEKGIQITKDEATLFLLGIFEETGKLTYSGTTSRDAYAAARLIELGARLFTLRQFIDEKLDDYQVLLYEKTMNAMEKKIINGVSVHISSFSCEKYVSGLDIVAKKIRDEEKYKTLIIIAGMRNNVYIVGRTSSPYVNLPGLVSEFGGGGHLNAVAASISKTNYIDINIKVLNLLKKYVRNAPVANDIMSSPVKTININEKLSVADELLTRIDQTVLMVVNDKNELVGLLKRRDVDKALHHKLHNSIIKPFTSANPVTIATDSTLEEMHDLFIRAGFSCLPVLKNNNLTGLVTRKNFLSRLRVLEDKDLKETKKIQISNKNFIEKIRNNLGERIYSLIKDIGRISEKFGISLYLVGGIVRDIILDKNSKDIDIIAEPGSISTMEFFRHVTERLGGKIVLHEKFQTATMTLYDGTCIDFSTARSEFYEYPAALPKIEAGSISTDLSRRDFTINAMALSINSGNFGELLDPFHGVEDISRKIIKILPNPLSFIEDPQRIFRAVRFSTRLNFEIEEETLKRLKYAVNLQVIDKMDLSRVQDEIQMMFSEKTIIPAIMEMQRLNILNFISPEIKLNSKIKKCLRYLNESIDFLNKENCDPVKWIVCLNILFMNNEETHIEEIYSYMKISKKITKYTVYANKIAVSAYEILNKQSLRGKIRWELYELLKEADDNVLAMILVQGRSRNVRKNMKTYLNDIKNTEISISGNDLIENGLKPGPLFSKIKNEILKEKISENIESVSEEFKMLKRMIKNEKI